MTAHKIPLLGESSSNEWLSITGAAEVLGVHPSTVRLWSDKGVLPVHRTQGGHRRYKRSEMELWMEHNRHQRPIEPQGIIQMAVKNIRLQIAEGKLEAESWYQKLDDDARMQYRRSSHILFQGLVAYLASYEEDGVSDEAHSIGYDYALRAHRVGLSAIDAVRAFLFFRDVLLQSIILVYQDANIPSGKAWSEMLERVNSFTDQILLQLLETFQSLELVS
jgi:excisionase family DNA binding protein